MPEIRQVVKGMLGKGTMITGKRLPVHLDNFTDIMEYFA